MVVYQIYPISFKDSDGDGKGDLRGIIEKIEYLKWLGVDAVWICPFFKSPMKDFGYDISDYTSIDPAFGTMEDFDALVHELHKANIKIIIDFVANHTSNEHPWFLESKSSRDNPKRDWYVWHDPKSDGAPPNNWISVFGSSAWELDPITNSYYLHSFLKEQPDLNWKNHEVQEAIMEVADFWAAKGVDGFRIDAIQHFVEDEKLRDDPKNPNYVLGQDDPYNLFIHKHSKSDSTHFKIVAKFLLKVLKKYEHLFIISEAYASPKEISDMYVACPNERYSPFNFNIMNLPWEAEKYKYSIDEYEDALKPEYTPNYVLGNHDVIRIASKHGVEQARLLGFLLLSLRGSPYIYYGDEIGMTNSLIEKHMLKDLFGIQVPGLGRDPERSPMQWSEEHAAGFTKNTPWLPIPKSFKEINVETESKDSRSTLSMYKKLLDLRKSSNAMSDGAYVSLNSGNKNVFSFARRGKDGTYIVFLNFSHETVTLAPHRAGTVVANSHLDRTVGQKIDATITLWPYEGVIIKT